MGLSEKIDVLDLIIDVLREHERELNDLIGKLEDVINKGGVRIAIMPPAYGGLYHQLMELLRKGGGLSGSEIARRLGRHDTWMRGYLYALQELGLVKTRRLGSAILYYPIDEGRD